MKNLLVALVLLVFTVQPASADEISPESVVQELKGFGTRLFDESKDFATTPFTMKDGNLFWSLGIVGVIGLTYSYDGSIRDKLSGSRSRGVDKAADAGELIGNPYLQMGMAALVYGGGSIASSPRWKETGEMMAEALFLADASTLLIKEGTGRSRPEATSHKGTFRPFQFKNDQDSFPSMHTASSFAMASVISRRSNGIPVAVLAYSAATFVGFSRMYQNKHWASDVLFGAAIGELSGRVVTLVHADKGGSLAMLPVTNGKTLTMNLLYRF